MELIVVALNLCLHSLDNTMREMQINLQSRVFFLFPSASDPLMDDMIVLCNQCGISFARFLHTAVKSLSACVPVSV